MLLKCVYLLLTPKTTQIIETTKIHLIYINVMLSNCRSQNSQENMNDIYLLSKYLSITNMVKIPIFLLQYVVLPTRRSTAEAFQILISHAFGDAGSPYLIGLVCIRN